MDRMKITHGLMNGQVLQRDARGRGGAAVSGTSAGEGDVELRVLKANKVVRGHDWSVVGYASGGEFHATLSGLRSGGPYRVELRLRKGRKVMTHAAVEEIFVGDGWILAGQSNMEGIGCLEHAPDAHEKVRAFYMRDEWGVAEEPLHLLSEAVDPVHNGYGNGPDRPSDAAIARIRKNQVKGMSPGHVFALDMLKRTRVPQGLIACAHGGTSMSQWSPALRGQGGRSFYGAMMRRYEKLGQPIAGIVWYQGESDANAESAAAYTDRMIELVAATRSDMGLPKLPWLIVQLGCHASLEGDEEWNRIQEQQRRLPEHIRYLDVAPAIDLELDDGIHIGGRGHHILGRRLGRIADRLVHRSRKAKPGIVLRKLELVETPGWVAGAQCMSVRLTYGNVVGKLVGHGRPAGFALLDYHGRDIRGFYKTTLEGSSVLLHTNMPRHLLETLSVSYGHGRYPVCTITDQGGMSIPGMQAVPINPDHARFVVDWETARLPGVRSVASASLEKARRARGWRPAPPRAGFGVLPKAPADEEIGVFAMRATLMASEALEAVLLLGANSPFKLWLNGKPVLRDAEAGIPLDASQYRANVKLKRGANKVLAVFAPINAGGHIGICARVATPEGTAEKRVSL